MHAPHTAAQIRHAHFLLLIAGLLGLFAPTSLRADDALKAELEVVLQSMADAALKGDQQAYLASICPADEVFFTEQQAWAADFDHHIPIRLEYAIASEPRQEDDSAVASLRITWQMEGGGVRMISFPARFTRRGEGWRYAGEEWQTTEGDRVLVFHGKDQEHIAGHAARALPEVRERIIPEMGLEDDQELKDRVQHIKIYTSMAHLQFSIYMSYSDSLAGWNEPGESIKILASRDISRRYVRILLAHEYGHVASFQYGPKATEMPWWILEGVAEICAEPWANNGERTDRLVRRWATQDNLRDWPDLADFRGEAANHSTHVYRQGQHMVRFITDRFGREARKQWMTDMGHSATLEDATLKAFNITFDELNTLWRASLAAAPDPGT